MGVFTAGSRCTAQVMLGGIGEYLLFVPVAGAVCARLRRMWTVLNHGDVFHFVAFSAMRAYALASSGKRAWGILVFLVSISPGIMALVS